MKKYLLFLSLFLAFCGIGNGQLNVKELKKYALAARDSSPNCFVVYLKGDSVKGKTFTKKTNMISGKSSWFIDGAAIDNSNILMYQDENAYVYCYPYTGVNSGLRDLYGYEYGRLIKGKISLFSTQATERVGFGREVSHTYFFLSKDPSRVPNLSPSTSKQLEEMVKDYPPAVEKLKQEFKKINDKETNNYPAIIAVLKVYNEKK
ncbi:MAG TPA: hypothetical protein VK492_05780 [Chitinophagaceae bacterium]|nr:hypothetical protein [Chitinophagaceae bacterium]